MYILLLYLAAIVLAFVLEFVPFYRDALRTPISAAADERWWPKLERRAFRRLAAAGGAAAFVLVAGSITMDLAYPEWRVRWNLIHPYLLLIYGAVFCFIALLCGAKPRQPVLLLCLTLPGLVVMPLVWLSTVVTSENVIAGAIAVSFVFFLQPAVWILLFIGLGQGRMLSKPGGNFTPGGFVRLCLILAAYLFGTFAGFPVWI